MPDLTAAVVAAVKGKGKSKGNASSRGSSPARNSFPKDHCYHCRQPGHSRTAKGDRKGCPAFAKLLKDNGGKLPDGYKGAFEKHVAE